MEEKESVRLDGVDMQEPSNKIFMCMFHDLRTDCHGINIIASDNTILLLLDKDDSYLHAGGILTKEKAKALRDFLNDLLNEG